MPKHAVIILAAGKGTRMKSHLAKVLHSICGRPMIAYPLGLALATRPTKVVLIVGHQADRVERVVREEFPRAPIEFVLQETQDGTAHAVVMAKPALKDFSGEVLILSGDVPLLSPDTLRAFRTTHRKRAADVSVMTTHMADPTGYGRCLVEDDGKLRRLKRIVEQKDASAAERAVREINGGIYWVDAGLLWQSLARIGRDNAQGEMYLTDLIHLANLDGKRVLATPVADSGEVLGVNSRVELATAAKALYRAKNEYLMREGVTFIDPDAAYLDNKVTVGRDTIIEPQTMITGCSRVGENCRIALGARLHNVVLGDDVQVTPHTVLSDVRIESGRVVS